MTRARIPKTLKLYVGGKFVRSESGRVDLVTSSDGAPMYVPSASRKDLRDAMETARSSAAGWSGKTAYNRGQILYRLAETLDDRVDALPTSGDDARAAADRAVHHAGWCDKIGQLLATVNPVSTGHVNYSHLRAMGVFLAVPHPADALLGMVEAVCAPLVMGNAVILVVPAPMGELAVAFAEALAVSDVPAGVVAVLTGDVPSMLDTADILDDLDGMLVTEGALSSERLASSQKALADVMRRLVLVKRSAAAGPRVLERLGEVQTVWLSS